MDLFPNSPPVQAVIVQVHAFFIAKLPCISNTKCTEIFHYLKKYINLPVYSKPFLNMKNIGKLMQGKLKHYYSRTYIFYLQYFPVFENNLDSREMSKILLWEHKTIFTDLKIAV